MEAERGKLVREKEALARKVGDQRSRWETEFIRTVSQLEELKAEWASATVSIE